MTLFEMNQEKAFKLLLKFKKGEYDYNNLEKEFIQVCPKSWKQHNIILDEDNLNADGHLGFAVFMKYIDEIKYGLEYKTNGKIEYIGTNDLHTLIIK